MRAAAIGVLLLLMSEHVVEAPSAAATPPTAPMARLYVWVVRSVAPGYQVRVDTLQFASGRVETLLVVVTPRQRLQAEPDHVVPDLTPRPVELGHELLHRLGVVFARGDTCYLAAATDSIPLGALVHVLLMDTTHTTIPLRVVARVRGPGRALDAIRIDGASSMTLYRLSWLTLADELEGVGVGAVQLHDLLRREGGRVIGDLNDDDTTEVVSSCAADEGVHFLVRSAANGRLRWHGYFHLGHDVGPTCSDEETAHR